MLLSWALVNSLGGTSKHLSILGLSDCGMQGGLGLPDASSHLKGTEANGWIGDVSILAGDSCSLPGSENKESFGVGLGS